MPEDQAPFAHEQSNRNTAEMIAKFRTPPGVSWDDLANDIETALDTRSNAAKWQPIETAPKDGTAILIFSEGLVRVGCYCAGGWSEWVYLTRRLPGGYDATIIYAAKPTHWMRLPAPPK